MPNEIVVFTIFVFMAIPYILRICIREWRRLLREVRQLIEEISLFIEELIFFILMLKLLTGDCQKSAQLLN